MGKKRAYQRLPGRLRGVMRTGSVWAAEDHLLVVQGWRFVENYQRLAWKDIQGIAVARTPRFPVPVWWLFWTLFAGLFALIFLAAKQQTLLAACCGAFFLLLAYWSAASFLLSCRCVIQTAVSRVEVPCLYRRWMARRFLRSLEARIAQVQGQLAADWQARMSPDAPTESSSPAGARIEAEPAAGVAEYALYLLLIVTAAVLVLAVTWKTPALNVAHTLLPIADSVLGAIVLVRQFQKGAARRARLLAAIAVVSMAGAAYLNAYVPTLIEAVKTRSQMVMVHAGAALPPGVGIPEAAVALAIGALGLLRASRAGSE